jgi:hypothetical protein
MSTIKVDSIKSTSTNDGGISIDTSGHVTVDGLALPSAGPLSNRNKIINGDMRIDQRNAGVAVTTSGSFPVDRFVASHSSDGAFSAQRDTSNPAGFTNSLKVTCTTADTSLSAGQYLAIIQNVEGFNSADIGFGQATSNSVTLSFWTRSSLTGTFGGGIRNSAANRSYPFTYSISSADTWEYKTVTITVDTSGTWLSDNGIGLRISWGLGAGTDWSGPAGAWNSNNNLTATGATSLLGTLNATFYLTGVQLEVGSVATPFEHRSYGDELARCQRYYQKLQSTLGDTIVYVGYNAGTTVSRGTVYLPVSMRTNPTAVETTGTASDYNIRSGGSTTTCNSVPSFEHATTQSIGLQFNVSGGLTSDAVSMCRFANTDAFLAWGAEL